MARQAPESPQEDPDDQPAHGPGVGVRRIVWFEAPGCVHCAAMRPRLDAVAERRPSVPVERINARARPDLADEFGVQGTPTLVALDDGTEVARLVGSHGEQAIERLFTAQADAQVHRNEASLWMVTGTALVTAGALTGPAWALVAIGAAVAGYGVLRLRR